MYFAFVHFQEIRFPIFYYRVYDITQTEILLKVALIIINLNLKPQIVAMSAAK
jgi:hypothetical protein